MRMARVKIQRLALKRLDERRKVFFQMASGKKFKLFCFNGWRHFNGFEFVQGGNIMGGGAGSLFRFSALFEFGERTETHMKARACNGGYETEWREVV